MRLNLYVSDPMYRAKVWKGEKEGGRLTSREFKTLDKLVKWLGKCEGECEVFDLSSGEERLSFSGDVQVVCSDVSKDIDKRDRERREADEAARHEREAASRVRAKKKAAAARAALQKRCRVCEATISRNAETCPQCGEVFRRRYRPQSNTEFFALIFVAIVISGVVLMVMHIGCNTFIQAVRDATAQP